jgi:glucan biosynthesis protein C
MKRHDDIDALRAIAFSLLIGYHVAMLYVAGWDLHLKSTHPAEWLQGPMILLNRWRMDLIFLVSGVATALMMRRSTPGGFLAERTWRLLLPLAFGMAVVIPIQPYCQGVANGLVEPGFLRFLERYFTAYRWPKGAFDGWDVGVTWNHLWYLPYLFAYTVVLAAIRPLAESRIGERLTSRLNALRGWRLVAYPAIPLFASAAMLQWRFPATHDLAHDWYNHATYFTVFAYGWLLGRLEAPWEALVRARWRSTGMALATGAAYMVVRRLVPDEPGALWMLGVLAVRSLYAWCAIAAILGWGRARLDRPFRWLPFARQSIYPWYVLHQSVIVVLAYWLVPMRLPAVPEAALIASGTVAGCWFINGAIVTKVRWLRACFGLKPRDAGREPAPARPVPSAARLGWDDIR